MKIKEHIVLRRIFLILFGISLCCLLEAAACFVLPDKKLNLLESIYTACQEDNQLLWKQKKNLDIMFQGKNVRTNSLGLRNQELVEKKADISRLICLGESSTFGWGVDADKTYPMRLQSLINDYFNKKVLEVINAGQIGYTSYQGKVFFEKYLLKYKPDIMTVSYVLNDIDEVRFFKNEKLADSEIPVSGSGWIILKNHIVDKRIYFLAKRFVFWVMQKDKRLSAEVYKKKYENSKIRVSAEEYKQNLEDIIALCRTNKIKLILIVMPINLASPDDLNESVGGFSSNMYYLKAKKFEEIKDFAAAGSFYKKALDYQVLSCKENGKVFQNIMMRLAKENDIPLIDAEELFSSYAKGKKIDLFNGPTDRIHPNAAGHMIIAAALKQCIVNNAMLSPAKNMAETDAGIK